MSALHPLAKGVQHPSPLRHEAPWWLVSVGLIAAPAAWSLQLLVSYVLNGDRCAAGRLGALPFEPTAMLYAIIGVIAVATSILGLWAAHRTWRLTREEGSGDHHEGLTTGIGRTRFLGLSGIVSSSIFIVGAVFALLVPFLVSPCFALFF
ncbi:hypothetical protein EN925_37075 [Mesorhizobium sp. M7A.F.Ca.US.006.04.2.1]|uniref:hypothetical protein n=1 Tax=unclassified Mesorhizobium TaxID=325217 RepID=UPI000FCA4DED|nr:MULTISPECIES: hypothetical protein [unclassified Mesorhizobium]RUX76891.1 hypothetical protein EN990_07635 [Mesorhizobium sp. M7A.F.Ca.US.005.03.1.1]RUY05796.1 hypothetical protein EN991_33345 [Mesorhizobium sp. M7A.F.Ca.US.005.03.2.1]RVA73980.1 hypothetical protein EN925_37075 [Mesorhizobium sp. M7A.F.Ca.US.006.04.2.1]